MKYLPSERRDGGVKLYRRQTLRIAMIHEREMEIKEYNIILLLTINIYVYYIIIFIL